MKEAYWVGFASSLFILVSSTGLAKGFATFLNVIFWIGTTGLGLRGCDSLVMEDSMEDCFCDFSWILELTLSLRTDNWENYFIFHNLKICK